MTEKLTERQLAVVKQNTQTAINTGLASRYCQVLRNTPEAFGLLPGSVPEDTREFMEEVAAKCRQASGAELDIAYQRLTLRTYSSFFVVMFDAVNAEVLDHSQKELCWMLAANPREMAPSEGRDALFAPEDPQTLFEGYKAQLAVGLNTIVDIDMSRWT